MQTSRFALSLACAAMLASCGGGSSGNTAVAPTPTPTPSVSPTPTPTPTTAQCSLQSRQDWTLAQLDEWYLFPNLLDQGVDQAAYSDVQSYIDALVAPARAESRDRFFTYITSIEEENAFFEQGASAGFGIRLGYDTGARRVFVIEAFEDAPALGRNIDRGTEILAIGNGSTFTSVNTLMAADGPFGVIDALGPSDPGVTRVLRVVDQSGVQRDVSLSKTEFELDPVSDRYGARIIEDGGRRVGYLNLRTFIDTAGPDLLEAFSEFRQQGVTELIIDFRYNGGGLISISELMGDLLGRGNQGNVFDTITFREDKSEENSSYIIRSRPQSIAPSKIAFIGTSGTASASEMVINGIQPYLPASGMALVGSNTFGKPVGQIALDEPACDDRLRVVAFQVENANGNGDYYTGLADTVPNTCAAFDDILRPLGDPDEAMISTALDFLAGRSCTPIGGDGLTVQSTRRLEPLRPRVGNTAQRDVPGLF